MDDRSFRLGDHCRYPPQKCQVVNQHYDIPRTLKRKCNNGTPVLRDFYLHFFVDSYGLTRGDVDLDFLNDLSTAELEIARELIRRNLHTGYSHIIEGAAALRDSDAIPILRLLLSRHSELSRRLTITGSLWRLDRDTKFLDCIAEMVTCDSESMKVAHMDQILWIGDERSIHFLIRLLDDADRFVRSLALSRLNEIEHNKSFVCDPAPTPATEYIARQSDPAFIARMVATLSHQPLINGG